MKTKSITERHFNLKFDRIDFLDLSIDLDRGLLLVAQLTQNGLEPIAIEAELGYVMVEYLGKRTALEHVYFGRSLKGVLLSESKLKAEIWRIQKIKAKAGLSS